MINFFKLKKRIKELEKSNESLVIKCEKLESSIAYWKEKTEALQMEKDNMFIEAKLRVYEQVLDIQPRSIFIPRGVL